MGDEAAVPGEATRQDRPGAQDGPALRLALLGLAGASIEWYDFFIYATAAALVFPRLFFSETLPPLVALIASFSTFAVGFVARPGGAVLFGHLGDRVGRKAAFAAALITMGAATTLIGVLPSYHAMGVFAPIALVRAAFYARSCGGGAVGWRDPARHRKRAEVEAGAVRQYRAGERTAWRRAGQSGLPGH